MGSFYDENENRYYPFKPYAIDDLNQKLSKGLILDAGFIIVSDIDEHPFLRLYRLNLYGTPPTPTGVEVHFKDSQDRDFIFNVPIGSTYGDRITISQSYTGITLTGYLIVGNVEQALKDTINTANLTVGQIAPASGEYDNLKIEPATIQVICRQKVKTLNIANDERTTLPEIGSIPEPVDQDAIIKVDQNTISEGITGEVTLKEGYNCQLRSNLIRNSVQIIGFVGAGAGEPCEFWNPGETEEKCTDLIYSITGAKPNSGNLAIIGGENINIITDTAPHTVLIRLKGSETVSICD